MPLRSLRFARFLGTGGDNTEAGKELAHGHNLGQTELERTAREDCRQEAPHMPSRGSAAPSDCGTGGGGGVSGQMADTHTSNWLLAVAQRVDEIMIRRQTLMEETTVFAEESARLDDESTGLGVLVEAARMNFNETLTGSHDIQTLQTRLGAMDEGQGRRGGRRASRLHREMSAIAEKPVMLDEEMLALTAEMAHSCEANPVAARYAAWWHGDEPATAHRPLPDRWRCCSKRSRGNWRRTPRAT